ncbi:MAG: GFA family protein [Alphaproteobacteria bacterium]|nr:GFA family protein [Alphaproteobacteria bacterium]
MDFPVPATGGCNCDDLRYRLTKAPLTAFICHCHLCQKRTGSAFSMSMVFPADALHFEKGEPFKTERALPNGSKNISYICRHCYSRIYTQRNGSPTINVRVGTLDDTSSIRPVAQIWTSSAQHWAVQKDILSYAEQPSDFAALLEAWKAVH